MAARKRAKTAAQPPVPAPEIPPAVARLLAPVTAESLAQEAAALDPFRPVGYAHGDVVADADELLGCEGDVPELAERGYQVNAHLFERLRLLRNAIPRQTSEGARAREAVTNLGGDDDARRRRLLEIRRRLAALAALAALPPGPFQLRTTKSDRLAPVVDRMRDVIAAAREHEDLLPDRERVRALLEEGERIVTEDISRRAGRTRARGERGTAVGLTARYLRLLWDAMQHLSKVGLAAFADDARRRIPYALANVAKQR